ncbi:MAG: hypothetical protein II721_01760, partial [Bacilli bacterium]|nr:hypothetical protein [Bacilli bacterium]
GGSFITVQSAEKVTFSISYDEATDRGTANHMLFFIDSSTDNGDTHAGHIVLSNFNFELVA